MVELVPVTHTQKHMYDYTYMHATSLCRNEESLAQISSVVKGPGLEDIDSPRTMLSPLASQVFSAASIAAIYIPHFC